MNHITQILADKSMVELILNYAPQLSHDEWLKARQTYIGGADTAVLMGLNKWNTPQDVYNEKVNGITKEMNLSMKRGIALQSVVLDEYQARTGHIIIDTNYRIFRHPKYEFIGGTFDALALTSDNEIGVIEVKTAVGYATRSYRNGIPQMHIVQTYKYWMILRAIVEHLNLKVNTFAEIVSLLDDRLQPQFRLSEDKELEEKILEEDIYFWMNYVIPKVPPESHTEDSSVKTLEHNTTRTTYVEVTDDIVNLVRQRNALSLEKKKIEEEIEKIDKIIKEIIEDKDGLSYNNEPIAYYTTINFQPSFDTNKFKEKYPDLYNEFLVQKNVGRRLLYKKELF